MGGIGRIPPWVRFSVPGGPRYVMVKKVIEAEGLHTVCTEARCPNMGECFGRGIATFLILGDVCTRNCAYCAVTKGTPGPVDEREPERVAGAVMKLGLTFAVITSVTRDDIPDGGASHFAAVIEKIRRVNDACGIEVLVPDFSGSMKPSVDTILARRPDVFNHNIEAVRGLFRELRPMGNYEGSIELIRYAASRGVPVKSGFMVGFGESIDDIRLTLEDLKRAGCRHVTVGQYLRSRRENRPVAKYYNPGEFELIARMALEIGIPKVQSAPLVRSSYHASEFSGCLCS